MLMNLTKLRGVHILVGLLVSLASVHAQNYEVTPLVGATFGGTVHLEQTGAPNFYASVADSINFGIAGGYRMGSSDGEGYDVFEFRWLRQDSHLFVHQDPLVPTPYSATAFRPSISFNHFLGDFTHEWTIQEARTFVPFVTGSLGAAVMSGPASSATRFEFGVGAGVKIFPTTHYGFRVKVEYLPIVMHAELQRFVCAAGCIVVLNGGVMNQFEVTVGPSFRF
jgi:hypothetical protein